MSPEQLGWAVGVSGHTVRRIERECAIPTPRVQYALAQFFGMRPTELWKIEPRRVAA
jgi:DNA-binding XRE family transcriptional regulator